MRLLSPQTRVLYLRRRGVVVLAWTDTLTPSIAITKPPFRIQEEGWGEFDMRIILTAADKEHPISHDLNFAQSRYESKHVIVRLIRLYFIWLKVGLTDVADIQKPQTGTPRRSARVRTGARRRERRQAQASSGRRRGFEEEEEDGQECTFWSMYEYKGGCSIWLNAMQVDMDRLADGLQKLGEDDLLQVVQMVHDNKAPDSYTKNDVERAFAGSVCACYADTDSSRGGIPRRPVHPPRQPDQDVVGLYPGQGGAVAVALKQEWTDGWMIGLQRTYVLLRCRVRNSYGPIMPVCRRAMMEHAEGPSLGSCLVLAYINKWMN